jgi:small multidrug resistance family-3 protein
LARAAERSRGSSRCGFPVLQRILAAYGGIFFAGSIAWGMLADDYRPDRFDIIGALVCLAGRAVIMCAPRGN